ncbi:MAG: type II toxin-antitoxin system VapC family toxin [Bacteroidetes bacterium]|nr:type II toxin-antitoxin system VapC family toxin [Bacteroidota bacterium]
MKLLLDSHTFIWFVNGDKSLPKKALSLIKDIDNTCYISIASIWEIALKVSLKKLELKSDFNKITGFLTDNEIEILPLTFEHIQTLIDLEFHHSDPFDRILISQSICEDLVIITKDSEFNKYKVKLKWS